MCRVCVRILPRPTLATRSGSSNRNFIAEPAEVLTQGWVRQAGRWQQHPWIQYAIGAYRRWDSRDFVIEVIESSQH